MGSTEFVVDVAFGAQRVNDFDAARVGVVTWSRYLTAEEAQPVLDHIKAHPCPEDRKTNGSNP